MYILWPAGNGSVGEVSFQWSPIPGVQRAACLLPESLDVSVCAKRQHWPVSRQCGSEILSCIEKRGREPRNIFELALPVYHGLDGSLGVFGLPVWVPAPPVPIICHLAIPTIPFQSWWPLLLWLVGFGLQCILESLALAPHSSTLAWKIPWTEEPGRLQSMGSRSIRQDWATSLSLFTFMHWRRKWQPTPVFLPEEYQGQGSLVGCRLWGRTESDTTEAT